jgi:hypothetical protein
MPPRAPTGRLGLAAANPATVPANLPSLPLSGGPAYQVTADDLPPVWPHPEGATRGVALEPLYPSAPVAALRDPALYELLALIDAIREGRARERKLAEDELRARIHQIPDERPNRQLLVNAVELLGPLLDELVFVGGCATGLLITDPASGGIRPTIDVDTIVEVKSYAEYAVLSERLRNLGLAEDSTSNVICRWRMGAPLGK